MLFYSEKHNCLTNLKKKNLHDLWPICLNFLLNRDIITLFWSTVPTPQIKHKEIVIVQVQSFIYNRYINKYYIITQALESF